MPPSRLKSALLNTLGALAYLFCLLQWVWTAVLFLPGIMRSDFMKQFLQKPVTPPPVTSQAVDAPVAGIIFMAIFVVLMIVATLYIIIKIPSVVGKTGSKITHKTTDLTLPIVTHHKELPAKKRLQLTARLLFIVKILYYWRRRGALLNRALLPASRRRQTVTHRLQTSLVRPPKPTPRPPFVDDMYYIL
jgi:hypothetical protein